MARSADIVFCLDASGSMKPCIDGVRDHIASFVDGLSNNAQMSWDVRFGLLGHRANDLPEGGVVANFITLGGGGLSDVYGSAQERRPDALFTSDVDRFRAHLAKIEVKGDEAPFLALDVALDFPWRTDATCHRVVVLLTDETMEDGAMRSRSAAAIDDLLGKIHSLGVQLFIVGPDSDGFDALAQADKSEYDVVDTEGDGLAHADFSAMLRGIGKSVSVSTVSRRRQMRVQRALFGQDSWQSAQHEFFGG